MIKEIHIHIVRKFTLYDKHKSVGKPDEWFEKQEKLGNKKAILTARSDDTSKTILRDVRLSIEEHNQVIQIPSSNSSNNNNVAPEEYYPIKTALEGHKTAKTFMIGSWQTGDFGHIYAASFCHYSSHPSIPFGLLVLRVDGAPTEELISDIKFAIGSIAEKIGGTFYLFTTDSMEKDTAIAVMSGLTNAGLVYEPYDATFMAEKAVKTMGVGEPLCDVWAALVKKEDSSHYKFYGDICEQFTKEYLGMGFPKSIRRERFICVWARTSGTPTPKRPLGGANPQYDTSPTGVSIPRQSRGL